MTCPENYGDAVFDEEFSRSRREMIHLAEMYMRRGRKQEALEIMNLIGKMDKRSSNNSGIQERREQEQ